MNRIVLVASILFVVYVGVPVLVASATLGTTVQQELHDIVTNPNLRAFYVESLPLFWKATARLMWNLTMLWLWFIANLLCIILEPIWALILRV